jgi:type II secretory pathway component PulM
MKRRLRNYADGIDAMALRERAMFFGAVALVLMTLLQVFLLNPVLSRRNQLSAQIAQQEDETKAIQAKSGPGSTERADRDALNRDRFKSLREHGAVGPAVRATTKTVRRAGKMAAMLRT